MNVGLLKRWRRQVLILGLGLLAMCAICWATLPMLLQWQIEKQGTLALGRAVTVDQVIFKPWSMRLIVRGMRVAQAGGDTLVQPAQLTVDEVEFNASIQSLFAWAPVADAVRVRNPQLKLRHLGQGRYDIDDVLARLTSSGSQSAGVPRLSLFNIQLSGGGVEFRDEPHAVTHTLSDLQLDIPFLSNLGGRREVATHPRLVFRFNEAVFDTDAQTMPFAADRRTQAHFQVKGLDVAPYLPYWPAAWPVRLTAGQLAWDLRLDFRQETQPELSVSGQVSMRHLKLQANQKQNDLPLLQVGGVDLMIDTLKPLDGVLKLPQIRVTDVSWGSKEKPEVSWTEMRLEQLEVAVAKQWVRVGRVGLTGPQVNVTRDTQGRWMFEDWLAPAPSTPSPGAASHPWQLDMGPLQISEGVGSLDDQFVPGGAKLETRDFKVSMGAWQLGAASPQMISVKVDFTVGAQTQRRSAGQFVFDGAVHWPWFAAEQVQTPGLQLKGHLQLNRFPLQRLRAYGADWLNFNLRRADLSYTGDLDLTLPKAGPGLQLQGNLVLENLRALNSSDGGVLLDIQALNLRGIELGLEAGTLKRLKIAETGLSDFFAHVLVDAQGHLNLQHLVKAQASASSSLAPSDSAPAKPVWILGPIGVVNGRVLFTDHFIKPHYSADITELAGSLGATSNQKGQTDTALADLNLRGRVAGSGTLEVSGRINPLTRPVALDVRGQVRDLELPQLSPYSRKYAGYGIERGKLSAQVNYRISAEGQLQASHQIVLNQLRFGERSDSPDTPDLPVKLAAALLADRHGVIDINLPVSGSLQDPDFRVGAIVGKMMLNLIGKAIISPFSLISGVFSSQEQLQSIEFMPGRADLDAASRQKLHSVAQLMIDKPALHLTMVGEAHLDSEREAWRRAQLGEAIAAEKVRHLPRDAQTVVPVLDQNSEEYTALLQSVYRRSPIPKPRHLSGLIKDLPLAEMEALLLAAVSVDETDMRGLAQARAQQVRGYLLSLNVPATQLFLGAPVVNKSTAGDPLGPKVNLVVSVD
jgi:uncharacterized protein involved in outer membrane biogenesis